VKKRLWGREITLVQNVIDVKDQVTFKILFDVVIK